MGIQSNGVFVAINFVLHWEMTRDIQWLRSVGFPFVRDVFELYKCLLHRREDGTYVDFKDSDSECDPDGTFPGGLDPRCMRPNVADANAFIRRIAAALPSMAAVIDAPADPVWSQVAQQLVPLPTQDGAFTVCEVTANDTKATKVGAPPCNGTASGWFAWPGEAVTLNDTAAMLQTARRTLIKSKLWAQGNSLCSVYAAAARVGLSMEHYLPQFHAAVAPCVPNHMTGNPNAAGVTCTMPNGVVFQEGGGLEIAGGAEFINSMLVQSITSHDGSGDSYIALFPAFRNNSHLAQRASFSRLRVSGAFLISARCNGTGVVQGAVEILSEAGTAVTLENPWPVSRVVATVSGSVVATGEGRFVRFETKSGEVYSISRRV